MVNFWKMTVKLKDKLLKESGEKIAELEKQNEQLKEINTSLHNNINEKMIENAKLKEKNERLKKAHSDGWKQKDEVVNKLHYLYTTLTDHIRSKAENNPGISRYIDLVNYIDRLERD